MSRHFPSSGASSRTSVLDGATLARRMARMEELLLTALRDELLVLARSDAA
jgi:hypothetical protein